MSRFLIWSGCRLSVLALILAISGNPGCVEKDGESTGQNSGDSSDSDTVGETDLNSSVGDFDIGDMTTVSKQEFQEILCNKIKECDPDGYDDLVSSLGMCRPEIMDLLEPCVNYDGISAAICLKEAKLDNLSDFDCFENAGYNPLPNSCELMCMDAQNEPPHVGVPSNG